MRFLYGNKNNFYSSNYRFLCNVDAKNISAHLDYLFYESDHPSHAIFQISNFGENKIVFMFYACGLHVLCIVLMLIIHPYSGKHDVGRRNHGCLRWNLHLVERFYAVTKLIFIHRTTNFYTTSAQKNFFSDSVRPIGHHVP